MIPETSKDTTEVVGNKRRVGSQEEQNPKPTQEAALQPPLHWDKLTLGQGGAKSESNDWAGQRKTKRGQT